MKRLAGWAIITTVWLAGASAANATTHVVGPEQLGAALADQAGQRATDMAALDALLASPAAERAAEQTGLDVAAARDGLSSLTNAELRDLASRAARLERDPAAGLSGDVEQLLIIFLIIAIVILILQAVD